ncbi:hypothetical protein ABK040_005974 [Willaertia magna]
MNITLPTISSYNSTLDEGGRSFISEGGRKKKRRSRKKDAKVDELLSTIDSFLLQQGEIKKELDVSLLGLSNDVFNDLSTMRNTIVNKHTKSDKDVFSSSDGTDTKSKPKKRISFVGESRLSVRDLEDSSSREEITNEIKSVTIFIDEEVKSKTESFKKECNSIRRKIDELISLIQSNYISNM